MDLVNLDTKSTLVSLTPEPCKQYSALFSIQSFNKDLLSMAYENGTVVLWDLRWCGSPLSSEDRSSNIRGESSPIGRERDGSTQTKDIPKFTVPAAQLKLFDDPLFACRFWNCSLVNPVPQPALPTLQRSDETGSSPPLAAPSQALNTATGTAVSVDSSTLASPESTEDEGGSCNGAKTCTDTTNSSSAVHEDQTERHENMTHENQTADVVAAAESIVNLELHDTAPPHSPFIEYRGCAGSAVDEIATFSCRIPHSATGRSSGNEDADRCHLEEIGKRVKLTGDGVACMAYRFDGKLVVSGGWDGCIRYFSTGWGVNKGDKSRPAYSDGSGDRGEGEKKKDRRNRGLKPLAVLDHHSKTVNCMVFDSSNHLTAGSEDGMISIWDLYA